MNQSLQNWIADNLLTVNQINNKILEIEGVGRFLIVEPKTLSIDGDILTDKIFDDQFQLTLSDSESELTDNVDYFLFQFGNNWYYTNDLVPSELIPFRYIGKPKLDFPEYTFPMLGFTDSMELCNGSRLYEDWCKKAKFLGINTLGIAEENTLAGTLAFQEDCKKKEIKA
jgi:DNA polymerase-3 subunit alpha